MHIRNKDYFNLINVVDIKVGLPDLVNKFKFQINNEFLCSIKDIFILKNYSFI